MKVRHTAILSSLLLLFLTTVVAAQGSKAADFSGRWISETVTMQTDRPLQKTDTDLKIELDVTQSENELRLK